MRRLSILALALLPLSIGCGSSESDKTAPFVGTWTVTSGSLTGTCPMVPPFMQKLDGGQQTITKTADGALSLAIFPGCNVILDVNGTTATLRATTPPQSCMFPFMYAGTQIQVMGSFTAGNFMVTGETGSFSYMGNAMAGPLTCVVMGMGMSMKGAAPDSGAPAADTGSPAADMGSIPDGP